MDPQLRRAPGDALSAAWGAVRRHPVITGTILGCAAIGAVVGLTVLTGDWSAARRIAAGSVAGAATGFVITATKMLG